MHHLGGFHRLRLKLYRQMGFTPVEEDGIYSKVLVRTSLLSRLWLLPCYLSLTLPYRLSTISGRPNGATRCLDKRLPVERVLVGACGEVGRGGRCIGEERGQGFVCLVVSSKLFVFSAVFQEKGEGKGEKGARVSLQRASGCFQSLYRPNCASNGLSNVVEAGPILRGWFTLPSRSSLSLPLLQTSEGCSQPVHQVPPPRANPVDSLPALLELQQASSKAAKPLLTPPLLPPLPAPWEPICRLRRERCRWLVRRRVGGGGVLR
jgi:hypothetical protein